MGRGHLSLGTMILTVKPGRGGEGSLSIGTMILTVEPGRGEGEGSFISRNNDSRCRKREGHLSLGTIILFQVHRERGRGGVMRVICL